MYRFNYTSAAPWSIVGRRGESGERNYELLSAAVHWEKLVCIGNCGRGSVSWLVRRSAFRAEFTAHRGLRTLDAVVSETGNFAVPLCVGASMARTRAHRFVGVPPDGNWFLRRPRQIFPNFLPTFSPRTNLKKAKGKEEEVARVDKKRKPLVTFYFLWISGLLYNVCISFVSREET